MFPQAELMSQFSEKVSHFVCTILRCKEVMRLSRCHLKVASKAQGSGEYVISQSSVPGLCYHSSYKQHPHGLFRAGGGSQCSRAKFPGRFNYWVSTKSAGVF